jgi:hypothetical protein
MSVELEARVRRANLISRDRHLERLYDDDLSRRLLRDIYSKEEGRMSETTDRPEPITVEGVPPNEEAFRPAPAPRQRRSPAFVPAILTAVIAIGVIVVLVARDQTPNVADTPVGIAEAFMTALSEHDADAVFALMAEDATVPEGDTEDGMRGEIRMEELQGWTYQVESCVETPGQRPSRVRCSYSFSNELARALGTGPYGGNVYNFFIQDGEIAAAQQVEPDQIPYQEAMVPFFQWVVDNRPEAGDMYWHYTDEDNLAKWQQYYPEWLASLEEAG